MAMKDLFPTLSMGPLPSRSDLLALKRHGVHTLINVSGTSIVDIYGRATAETFDFHEYYFRDWFTLEGVEQDEWERICREELGPLYQAIDKLTALHRDGIPVHCFCRQGMSRSSVVAAASIIGLFDIDVRTAKNIICTKNKAAYFTARSDQILHEFHESRSFT